MKKWFLCLPLFLFTFDAAIACSCVPPAPPLEALSASDAVFLGRVTDLLLISENEGFPTILVEMSVEQQWKGDNESHLVVYTARDGATCGYPFKEGKSYLVYANQQNTNGELWTNLCSRTVEEEDAAIDLAALGDGTRPARVKSTCGGPTNAAMMQTFFFLLIGFMSTRFKLRARTIHKK